MSVKNLDKIFKPKTVTVIGASNKIGSAGYRIFRNLIGSGYNGVVYPINPNYESIQGVEAYPNVEKLPKIPDLAVIVTPAITVLDIVEQCGKKGIKGILIISAGFKEIGEEGRALEKKLFDIKEKYSLRIVGPNCVGIIMPHLEMNATFAGSMPDKGNIALFSQSGAVCGAILDWAAASKVGFSSFVSVGSMLDVDFGDLIDYFGMDIHTRSIVLYIENVTNARKFMSAARGFARVKPIIVIKSGRFKEGAKAASSHTGAMAGEDYIYDAAFKRAGMVRVKKIGDLFNCASILAKQPRPTGQNLAIITNAGGPGVLATDSIIENGGKLATLSKETMDELNTFLPKYWSKGNPIDIIGDSNEDVYRKTIEVCLKDKNIDGLIVITVPQVMASPKRLAEHIIDISKHANKPILTSFVGEESVLYARQILNRNDVPTYATPEEAVESYMYLYHYERHLQLIFQTPEERNIDPSERGKVKIKKIVDKALKENRTLLNEGEAKEIIEIYGIKTTKPSVASSEDEAVQLAKKIGYPVVMKIHSPQITHKSDAGGVALNLDCEQTVRDAYKKMMKNVKEKVPDATIEGVTIQQMIKHNGSEFILGSKKDSLFGSIILFGMGGIFTELFKDRSIGFPPLNQVLAQRIIEKTMAYQLLKGFRNIPPANMQKVEETLINFSQLLEDHPEIGELDINPLVIVGDDIVAIDARIIIDPHHEKKPHMIISKYPSKYIKKVKLHDKHEVLLRSIKPEDELLWQDMFNSLSQETVRYRFFRVIKETPHEVRTRYCNIDYDRETAIVAEVQEQGIRRMIGVARMISEPGTEKAEFALVVIDKWQRLGLGAVFLDYLIEIAKDRKYERIFGPVLKDNIPMIKLCREKNFTFSEGDPGEYIVEYKMR